MSVRIDNEKEFISLFNSIARGTQRIQAFTGILSLENYGTRPSVVTSLQVSSHI